jgi:two-component system OmpR family sensor kinase
MITALLALVVIALSIISVASVQIFRNYEISQASQQVAAYYNQAEALINSSSGRPVPNGVQVVGPYVLVFLPAGETFAQAVANTSVPASALPDVPIGNSAWFKANAGRMVNVPAVSGHNDWRVITRHYKVTSSYFGQTIVQSGTLIVGLNLVIINGTVSHLAGIELIVGVIVVVGLAIVGIAIVRASLRPLNDIETTAQAIAAGDLSRRIPDHDPQTEVGRLGLSLNAMLAQIEASFHARAQSEAAARRSEERMRQFVADASHELRTPLTAMRGYAEYYRQRGGVAGGPGVASGSGVAAGIGAADGAGADEGNGAADAAGFQEHGLEPADLDRIMQRVEQESARMGILVEDMLLLARLDQQRPLERRPVDLLTLAADAVQDARIIAPDRRIDLSVGTGAAFLVLGDEVRLRQVISNLMNNALTHTPEGTPVEVRILAGWLGSVPGAVLEVSDHGPGMPSEQAEHVFERFYRADQARTRKTGGAGLGLAIVAALVAAHGGTVTLDTQPGRGATFRVTLPLAPEAQDHLDEPVDSPAPSEPPAPSGPPAPSEPPAPPGPPVPSQPQVPDNPSGS